MSATTSIFHNDKEIYWIQGSETAIEFLKLTDDELSVIKEVEDVKAFNQVFIQDDRLSASLNDLNNSDKVEVVIDY